MEELAKPHPEVDGQELGWMEDFVDLSVDDLRELPHSMQLGLDLSVYD